MRTLDELLEVATNAVDSYNAAVEASKKELTEVEKAISDARKSAEQATASGDMTAYEAAKKAEAFNLERATYLKKQTTAQYFTKEQYNAIIAETESAASVAKKPLYYHLHDLYVEWKDTMKQIEAINGKAATIDRKMQRTGRPLSGFESAEYRFIFGTDVGSALGKAFPYETSMELLKIGERKEKQA